MLPPSLSSLSIRISTEFFSFHIYYSENISALLEKKFFPKLSLSESVSESRFIFVRIIGRKVERAMRLGSAIYRLYLNPRRHVSHHQLSHACFDSLSSVFLRLLGRWQRLAVWAGSTRFAISRETRMPPPLLLLLLLYYRATGGDRSPPLLSRLYLDRNRGKEKRARQSCNGTC